MNVSKSKGSSIDPFRTPHAKNYHMNLFSFFVHDERDALSMLSIKTCHNTFSI